MMKIMVLNKEDQKESLWSGGRTTELFIYPPGANYLKRDFDFRISSARIEEEETQFSALKGYHRLLMPLDAPLKLILGGKDEVNAVPLQTVFFDGGALTYSRGRCQDLGLIYKPDYSGEIRFEEQVKLSLAEGFLGVYALEEAVSLKFTSLRQIQEKFLNRGDFCLVEGKDLAIHLKGSAALLLIRKNL